LGLNKNDTKDGWGKAIHGIADEGVAWNKKAEDQIFQGELLPDTASWEARGKIAESDEIATPAQRALNETAADKPESPAMRARGCGVS